MNSGNNNSNPSIAQISFEIDLELIKQRAIKFKELLAIVVNNYNSGDIQYVRRNLPDLDEFLSEIMVRTGKNYCSFTGQKNPDKVREYTSVRILKSKLFVRALGFPNGIPQDISDLDVLKLIQTIILEKIQKIKIDDKESQLEDKNWTTTVFKRLTGFDKIIVNSFLKDTDLTDIQVKTIIEQSRLFTEDTQYAFADNCCSQYVGAFMPFVKSLELDIYKLENEESKLRKARKTQPHLSSTNTLREVIESMGLKPFPEITEGNNSPDINQSSQSKISNYNDVDDYNI
jgi:hypothetical protein